MEENKEAKKEIIKENEAENETNENIETNEAKKEKKINFLKKIYYSVCKPSEYSNLAKEGVKSALIYFIIMLLIIAIVPAIFLTYSQNKIATEFASYLQENLPELTFSDNKLEISDGEVYILNDQKVIDLFGGIVVLNTNLENDEEIKEEYSEMVTDDTACIIFGADKMQVLYNDLSENDEDQDEKEDVEFEKNIQVDNYKYEDYASNFVQDTSKQYSKEDVINYFGNISVLDSFVQYYIMYFITIVVMMAINLIVIFVLAVIISKMLVIPSEIKELFAFSIYSTTLGNILYLLYLIISYITSLNLGDVNIVYLLIAYAYILIILIKKKRLSN